MIISARTNKASQNNNSVEVLEDLNFYEIEIKLCELQLQKLLVQHKYNDPVKEEVENFQAQFYTLQKSIKDCKQKLQRFWQLTGAVKLTAAWKSSKTYAHMRSDVDSIKSILDRLFFEFDSFVKICSLY